MTFREQTAQLLLAHALSAIIAGGRSSPRMSDHMVATMVVTQTDALIAALAEGSRK